MTSSPQDELDDAPAPPHEVRRVIEETRRLYARADAAYAPFSCPATAECCQLSRTGRPPYLWANEWRMLEEAVRPLPPPRADGACPFLDASGKRCTVYRDRPFGCRTFFCNRRTGPGREPLEEVVDLSRKLEALSRRVAPDLDAPRSLPDWFALAGGETGFDPTIRST